MSAVVSIARTWIGTPYVHQASAKGAGCDCLGLLRGVWRELYGQEPAPVPAYSQDWDEADPQEVLWCAAHTHLKAKPLGQASVGDVLLFRMRQGAPAKHLGLAADVGRTGSFIHAYQRHGVVESAFTNSWARRLVARFEI